VGVSGTGTTRTVTLSSLTGNGTLGISIAAGTATDTAGNTAPAAGPSATFTVDNAGPTISSVSQPANGSYKTGQNLDFTVTFSEPLADSPVVKLAISAVTGGTALAAAAMTKVDSTHYTYLYTVQAGNGTATVTMSIGTDLAGNVVTAAPTSGATFIVDNTPPTVSIGAPSATATAAGPVTYTVTYADANFNASTLGVGNITLNTTGTATASIAVTGSGSTRTVTLSSITGDGTVGISLAA